MPNLNIYPDLEWVYGTDPELSIEASVECLYDAGPSLQVRHAVLQVAENDGLVSVKVDRYWAVDYLKGDKFGRYILQKFYDHCPYDLSSLPVSA